MDNEHAVRITWDEDYDISLYSSSDGPIAYPDVLVWVPRDTYDRWDAAISAYNAVQDELDRLWIAERERTNRS